MKNKATKIIFPILYLTGLTGAGIIGLLSNSFFAYNAFNSLWANILYLLFISLLYVTAFVQELLVCRKIESVIINGFAFIGSLIVFLLMYFLNSVFTLCALLYSAVMLCLVGFDAALKVKKGTSPSEAVDVKRLVGAASLLLFSMASILAVKFVNELYLAWSLIPAAVVFVAVGTAAFFILRKAWGTIYDTPLRRIGNMIMSFILLFIIAFSYSFTALGIANYVFDAKAPTPHECIVLEKKISTGSRTPTQFEVKVKVAGGEKWISLPVDEYHEISEGSTVIINYHYGALNFAYLKYGGKG